MGVADHIALVDHHCHSVVVDLDSPSAFEALATESSTPAPIGTSWLDSPLGLAIRRWCAPIIDLDPLAPAADYLATRLAHDSRAVDREMLRAARLDRVFID